MRLQLQSVIVFLVLINRCLKVFPFKFWSKSKSICCTRMFSVMWKDLQVTPQEMSPSYTLNTGQCFNWDKVTPADCSNPVWIGLVDKIPLAMRETSQTTEYSSLLPSQYDDASIRTRLGDYFQLSHSLKTLYDDWAKQCNRMSEITASLPGVRVIRQDPWECLISFICSSNNNISRITQMLSKLRYHYGDYICTVHCKNGTLDSVNVDYTQLSSMVTDTSTSQTINGRQVLSDGLSTYNTADGSSTHHMFSFPSPESLASAREDDLRALGMGYRAKFIIQTAQRVASRPEGGRAWLLNLRKPETTIGLDNENIADSKTPIKTESSGYDDDEHREKVRQILQSLDGVGPKVADCVALFSLDQSSIVPVDTHVWSIVNRDYAERFLATRTAQGGYEKVLRQSTSLTDRVYRCVGSVFRGIFGDKAGWAHSVLFAAELPEFRRLLPEQLQREMKAFDETERLNKKLLKEKKASDKSDAAAAAAAAADAVGRVSETVDGDGSEGKPSRKIPKKRKTEG